MSNIPANNRLEAPATAVIQVDVQSHLDEEPDSACPGLPVGWETGLIQAVTTTLIQRKVSQGQIEVAVVDDATIRQVNQRHLQHDWETDVISFPYQLPLTSDTDSASESTSPVCGELILSWETACREASKTGWPPLTELLLYCVHGTLHLSGMDDIENSARKQMRLVEQTILQQLAPIGWQLYDVDRDRAAEVGKR